MPCGVAHARGGFPSRSSPPVTDSPAEFRPERIFAGLDDEEVRYLAVGAFAMIAHGVVRATLDVDIIPDTTSDNLTRLASAINALHGVPHGDPTTPVTPELLSRDANMRFDTEAGQLDVLSAQPYRRMFPDLHARSIATEVQGVPVRVVSRNDLIRLKAGSGRDRDLLDIGDLLALEE
jgi:hypothetical protein